MIRTSQRIITKNVSEYKIIILFLQSTEGVFYL